MSDHDVQLLAEGAAIGMYIMLILQLLYWNLDDRRDRKVERAARALLDEARAKADA
ncbi:hypothetical protein OH768_24820 [Streptomyces sp. NBC_01622]|uniref:hypothetical protein n=1 Tax=Streptomyces sp. NBC_01622 TaxID=2975903 RepID=UPI0038698745|nr:hypothetical protein OH768_24820 [Streptomyces sp. NBC_01622]